MLSRVERAAETIELLWWHDDIRIFAPNCIKHTSVFSGNPKGDGVFVRRDVSESVAAVAVEGTAKFMVGFADAVGGAGN